MYERKTVLKAGIVSLNLYTGRLNYGAALQSWMFQQLMLRRGDIDACEIIDYLPDTMHEMHPWTQLVRRKWEKKEGLVKMLGAALITPGFVLRNKHFQRFFRQRLNISDRRYNGAALESAALPYDLIFYESDVIWSPTYFDRHFDPVFFGAPAGMRRIPNIAYSVSMGDAQLTPEQRDEMRRLLEHPDFISMREAYAAELVRGLTDKPVADVVDPVLLADPEDFDPITSSRRPSQKYVMAYYTVNPGKYALRCARNYAREHNLKLIEVSIFGQHKLHNSTRTSAGVEDFMALLRGAEAVFSNSLHGTCLALLYHKEFYAMQHGNGGRKYQALCEKFGLADRFIRRNAFKPAAPIDWDRVDRLREQYRAESLAWLDAAIRAVDEGRVPGKSSAPEKDGQ